MTPIRAARVEDAPAVRDIYNLHVAASAASFDEHPTDEGYWTARIREAAAGGYPFLVAYAEPGAAEADTAEPGEAPAGEIEAPRLLGYALVGPWGSKSGFRYTVEDSIYLHPDAAGRGLGTALLGALLEASERAGFRRVIAVITDHDTGASLALHRRFGFVETGRLHRVARKFGRWHGVILLQGTLGAEAH